MNKKTTNVLCATCIYHGTLGRVDICTHTAPHWDNNDNVFVCHDFVEIKEKKDDEKKKL